MKKPISSAKMFAKQTSDQTWRTGLLVALLFGGITLAVSSFSGPPAGCTPASCPANPLHVVFDNTNPRVEINGPVKIGNTTLACAPDKAGMMRWNGSAFQGCNGTGWTALGSGGSTSCASENKNFSADGTYTVPAGVGVLKFVVVGGDGGDARGIPGNPNGGLGGNSCVIDTASSAVSVKANGGGRDSGAGQQISRVIAVTPGEQFIIRVAGGGGSGNGIGTTPVLYGGNGAHSGNSCELPATNGDVVGAFRAGNGGGPGQQGNAGAAAGSVTIITPTASELAAAGFTSACAQ